MQLPENGAAFAAFGDTICQTMKGAPTRRLDCFDPARTALVIVDMVNGFAIQGAMSSPRVEALISPIAALAAACRERGIEVIAPCDAHTESSIELLTYPPHCLKGDSESTLCSEIADAASVVRLEKNSTNAALSPAFIAWLAQHPQTDTFLLTGDCTDICVLQLALSLKAYYNEQDKPSEVVVDLSRIDTFDAPGHPADPLNMLACYLLNAAGCVLTSEILTV